MTNRALLLGVTVLLIALAAPAGARSGGVQIETSDVFGQGLDGPVVAADGATIRRTADGISMRLEMQTPQPGTYRYPETGAAFAGEGHPEVFTLWGFVFNNPENCATPFRCTGADVGDAPDDPQSPQGGAFAVAGHAVGGGTLNLSGQVDPGSEPFVGAALEDPQGAHVHLAVAPHGALDPEQLPEQLQTPTGPGPDIWWLALFQFKSKEALLHH